MWLKTEGVNQSGNDKVLAWDSIGKTIGLWDGWCLESITGDYSFVSEYSDGMDFFAEGEHRLIGRITHWMPLPAKPTAKKKVERRVNPCHTKKCGKWIDSPICNNCICLSVEEIQKCRNYSAGIVRKRVLL